MVGERGCISGVAIGSGDLSNSGIDWGGDLGDSGSSDDLSSDGLTVDNSVESVDGIGGILNSPSGAVGFDEGIGALDDVSAAALVLVLGVSGQGVLHVVAVAVLGIWIVIIGDDSFGNGNRGGVFGDGWVRGDSYFSDAIGTGVGGCGVGGGGVRVNGDGVSAGQEGGEQDDLSRG